MPPVSLDELMTASAKLGDAVIDPKVWPSVMEDMCRAVRAQGALLLQSDVRAPHARWARAVGNPIDAYFKDGWHERDPRGAKAVPVVHRGHTVVIDQDMFSQKEMRSTPDYNECYIPNGCNWWAVVGFWAGKALWGLSFQRTTKQGLFEPEDKRVLAVVGFWAGKALWGLSFQRTAMQGPFEPEDKRVLAQISQRLSEIATLSKRSSRSVLMGTINALNLVRQPAAVIDRLGFVLKTNATADQLFDAEIGVHNRRLRIVDKRAASELELLVKAIRVAAETDPLPATPIVVRRKTKPPILIRILPVEATARSPFLGARALLMLFDLGERTTPHSELLTWVFGLTVAEAKLASLIGVGESIEHAAECLGVSSQTARTQLKAVFNKTNTHRQGELAALLSRLRSFPSE